MPEAVLPETRNALAVAIFEAYDRYDALGLGELVRHGEVTPGELLDTALARVAARDGSLGAVVTSMEAQARAQIAAGVGDGPFAGVPFLLKDLMSAYAGVPMSFGSAYLKTYVPRYDAECVRRWRRAGLVMFGKTNAPEFGLVPATEPAAFPPTRNPWNPARTAGGSSGGSAAAVAAGYAPMASASDGGGSIRIPAACCGLVGLKPTRGRNPLGPVVTDPWMGFAVEHVVTRTVRDTAAALDATAGADPGAPYEVPPPLRPFLAETHASAGRLRVAVLRTPAMAPAYDPAVVRALDRTIALLESLGHELVDVRLPIDPPAFIGAMLTMVAAETAADIDAFARELGRQPKRPDLEVGTRGLRKIGRTLCALDLSNAVRTLRAHARAIGDFMVPYDVLLAPTLAKPPLPLRSLHPAGVEALVLEVLNSLPLLTKLFVRAGGLAATAAKIYAYIDGAPLANATGAPAISLPLQWSDDGLPLGMMFTARFGDEAVLIRLAAQLEAATPWFDRRPPLA